MRPIRTIASAMVMLLAAAACKGEESTDDPSGSLTLKDLRTATACPVDLDPSKLPEGLELRDATPYVTMSEYGAAVTVSCYFPIAGTAPAEEVEAKLVAAPPGTDIFSVEDESGGTWVNVIYNSTGVEEAPLQQAVSALSGEEVRQLQGTPGGLAGDGQPLAVRSFDHGDAGTALLFVYGEGTPTGDELAAVASALQ